jgi:hypothetical protein
MSLDATIEFYPVPATQSGMPNRPAAAGHDGWRIAQLA